MKMNVSSRMKQIKDLDTYLNEKQNMLDDILDQLGWKGESLTETKVCCPINPGHWLPESSLSHHQDICKWIEEGHPREELEKEPPDSSFFYEKSSDVIHVLIDSGMQERVLSESGLLRTDQFCRSLDFPLTVDRWTTQLTPEQRLAMYNHVVEVAKAAERPKNVSLEDLMVDFENKDGQDDKPKSQLELLAEIRDYKRRRQSYRAKNVHITKKSYTEIMKEVIENQTTYLAETIKSENSENSRREKEKSPSEIKKNYHDSDNYYSSSSSKYYERHSEYRDSSRRHHHSKRDIDDEYSPKRKKHRKDHSRSRSPSRHKKSHKHKRSHD